MPFSAKDLEVFSSAGLNHTVSWTQVRDAYFLRPRFLIYQKRRRSIEVDHLTAHQEMQYLAKGYRIHDRGEPTC